MKSAVSERIAEKSAIETMPVQNKNSVYKINTGWTNAAWNYTYKYIFPVAHSSELNSEGVEQAIHYYGLTQILKVELMHRISDTYGPVVYSKFGNGEVNSVDTQQEAYAAFFSDLDKGIDAMDKYLKNGGDDPFTQRQRHAECQKHKRLDQVR